MHKVFNAIAIQNFKLSLPHVLVTLIYTPAAYHDRLEIITARLILAGHRSFYNRLYTCVVATQASYVQLPVGFSHN